MAQRIPALFLVAATLVACGPTIEPIEREVHWRDVAAEAFEETQTLDSFSGWLRSIDVHEDLFPLSAKTESDESQFVVQLEDLGADWVCRYSINILISSDSTDTITGHHVYYVSQCL